MAPRMKVEVDASASNAESQGAPKPKAAAPKAVVEAPAVPASNPRPAAASAPVSAPKPRVDAPSTASDQASTPSPQTASPQTTTQTPAVSVVPPANPDQEYAPGANAGTQQQPAGGQQYAAQDPSPAQEPQKQRRTFGETREAASGWVHSTFAGHEHAFYGGLIALLAAVLIFIFGPLHVLLVCVLVVIGVAIGQYFDGDPKIIRMVGDLFNGNREQR